MIKAPPTAKKKKIAIFIDAANILYSQQTLGWEIDYKKFLSFFKKGFQLVCANFYSGKISKNARQNKFFKKMESLGYKVITKEVKWIRDKNGKILKGKGNLDIELAIDLTQSIDLYDTLILASGDSDFEPAVSFARQKGKTVFVVSSRGHVSKELIKAAHQYIPMEKLKMYIKRGG